MYIGVDIGGTNIRVGSTASLSDPHIEKRISFKVTHDYETDFSRLVEELKLFGPIQAIGIGTAGHMSPDKKMVFRSRNSPERENKPIVDSLQKIFSCPVFMENDGVACAYGEVMYSSKKQTSFMILIWGTGIGGANFKRQNGTVTIEMLGREYLDDWQVLCGGRNLEKRYKEPSNLIPSDLDQVMSDFKKHLTILIHMYTPKNIIFVGGIAVKRAVSLEKIFDEMKAKYKEFQKIGMEVSKFGEDAGLYGAFGLLYHGGHIDIHS